MKFHSGDKIKKPTKAEPLLSHGVRAADDPQVIQKELGEGLPLDGGVRSRMKSTFGVDFSHVRTHTDKTAARFSNDLNAKAFTVGDHVAFGANEYKPGTLIGDAIIAHELAHVVQQGGKSGESVAPMQHSDSTYNNMEDDADKSALSAIVSLWDNAKSAAVNITKNAIPQLNTGLRIQRCTKDQEEQARAAFQAAVTGITTGRRQPIPIPMPDPRAARGMLDLQYGINREDFIMWQADRSHSPRWESFYGNNHIDWSEYLRYGDSFGQIWPHFLQDAYNNTIPRERGGSRREERGARSR